MRKRVSTVALVCVCKCKVQRAATCRKLPVGECRAAGFTGVHYRLSSAWSTCREGVMGHLCLQLMAGTVFVCCPASMYNSIKVYDDVLGCP